jgi:hypothetical protein
LAALAPWRLGGSNSSNEEIINHQISIINQTVKQSDL